MSLWDTFTRALNGTDEKTKEREQKLSALFDQIDSVMDEITIDLKKPNGAGHGRRNCRGK